ncbi:MAG TPA: type II toxin-antitoxin system VapC family toxin [Abditibacterium sp.]|jgi:PIN domain nuclease of toxin-antitoxin system
MRILVDTHIFIWWNDELSLLSKSARNLLEDSNNQLVISAATLWEMQIKLAIGKLPLRLPLAEMVREQQEQNGFQILPITLPHVLALENLPFHHKDPFDRLLIAQAQAENLPILSADPVFGRYNINHLV